MNETSHKPAHSVPNWQAPASTSKPLKTRPTSKGRAVDEDTRPARAPSWRSSACRRPSRRAPCRPPRARRSSGSPTRAKSPKPPAARRAPGTPRGSTWHRRGCERRRDDTTTSRGVRRRRPVSSGQSVSIRHRNLGSRIVMGAPWRGGGGLLLFGRADEPSIVERRAVGSGDNPESIGRAEAVRAALLFGHRQPSSGFGIVCVYTEGYIWHTHTHTHTHISRVTPTHQTTQPAWSTATIPVNWLWPSVPCAVTW